MAKAWTVRKGTVNMPKVVSTFLTFRFLMPVLTTGMARQVSTKRFPHFRRGGNLRNRHNLPTQSVRFRMPQYTACVPPILCTEAM